MTPGRRGLVALAVLASVAFAVGAHLALVQGIPAAAGALLSLIPVAAFVLVFLLRRGHRVLALVAVLAIAAVLWRGWDVFEQRFPDLFFLEHVGINLALAFFFGRTLAAGREPLITGLARVVHGGTTPALLRYTRQVTIAWTVFFLAMALASTVLYAAGLKAAWSLLANVLAPILIAAMFIVEYAVRHRVLPDLERIGVVGSIRAFSRHVGTRAEAPR